MFNLRKSARSMIMIGGIVFFGAAIPARTQRTEIQIENGVTVVRNAIAPAPKPGGPSKVILTEDLVIGREATETEYLFAELRSVGVDDEERIWALDWEDIKVRIFDKLAFYAADGRCLKELSTARSRMARYSSSATP